jgi:hypothetical protein
MTARPTKKGSLRCPFRGQTEINRGMSQANTSEEWWCRQPKHHNAKR